MSNLPDPVLRGDSNTNQPQATSVPSTVASGLHKEQEPTSGNEPVVVEQTAAEVELTPDLEKAGVIAHHNNVELPPDVRQMGVEAIGPTQPVTYTGAVQLPLTDDQIIVGLHAQIISSLRWLAEWCIKRLKQAHMRLKRIGGRVVREKD